MKLTLDHTQRLNLHALLGAQRADVGSIRAIWAMQDKIALDAEEESAVELKRELVGGEERVLWNPLLSIPAREFEFADAEGKGRITKEQAGAVKEAVWSVVYDAASRMLKRVHIEPPEPRGGAGWRCP